MNFFSRLGSAMVSVFPITGMGLLCIPVAIGFAVANEPNHGTSGGLGVVIMAGLVVASSICAGILTVPAVVLFGLPTLLSFLILYFLSLTTIMFAMSS